MIEWNADIDGAIILAGVFSACACAVLGNFLVLRRLSLMGDAISHAVLPGLAIAFLISESRAAWPMFLGAVIVGALTTVFSETIRRYGKVEHGAAMGVVFSALFALGLVLIRQAADHVDLDPGCVLYGNIVNIGMEAFESDWPPAIVNLAIVLVVDLLFVGLFYKELRITAFDPGLAHTLGIHPGVMHYALMIMVAVTAVASFEAVGSILVIAMLIVPASAAYLLTDRLSVMIALSMVFACVSAVMGHVLAFYGPRWVGLGAQVSVHTSAMMAVVAGALFGGVLFLSPRYGIVARHIRRMMLSLQILREDLLGLLYRKHESHVGAEGLPRADALRAIGGGLKARWAMAMLIHRGAIQKRSAGETLDWVRLTAHGVNEAARVVGSHRLWESYLDRHFDLPRDHLHMPAERMEHYITPDLDETLREQLSDAKEDPHGRPIPDRGE